LACQKSPISLKEGALFVSDVHYHPGLREEFLEVVDGWIAQPPPQLFLMGDIFDLLVGSVPATHGPNRPLIERLGRLSALTECHYFEGNHDFDLRPIFGDMRIYPRECQPAFFVAGERRAALLHGDIAAGPGYELYTRAIRHPLTLQFLSLLNRSGWITRRIQRYNAQKRLCKKIPGFKPRKIPGADFVIEGHYHQDIITADYINLPAFGCSGEVVEYKDGEFVKRKMR
jgi:UDP-2,3-diacylglucosamine hydrolase